MHYEMIRRKLKGYFAKDVWAATHFKFTVTDISTKTPRMDFRGIVNIDIRNEIKFYYCYLLDSGKIAGANSWTTYVRHFFIKLSSGK